MFGVPIPLPFGQFARGRTEVATGRPYPCSLLPMIPTLKPPMVPILKARAKATVASLTLGYSDSSASSKLAEATIAAFTSGPETFGMRSFVTFVPVG